MRCDGGCAIELIAIPTGILSATMNDLLKENREMREEN